MLNIGAYHQPDSEQTTCDIQLACKLGVNTSSTLYCRPSSGGFGISFLSADDITQVYLRGATGSWMVDSISWLVKRPVRSHFIETV